MSSASPSASLTRYRNKRHAGRTPEPFGAGTSGLGPRRFVVHLHAARRLHYDLRLEIGGTLASWAVPRGPSADPTQKRLAAHVEDHPMSYGDFEGVIPEGNYGAGASIVWDRGYFEPHGDPEVGIAEGKLLFTLHGYKLRGLWTLVRMKGKKSSGKDWLLIKERDGFAKTAADATTTTTTEAPVTQAYPSASVLSGLTVEQRASTYDHARALAARVAALGAQRHALVLSELTPMLAETASAPFSREGWLFELKYDGYRLLAAHDGTEVSLRYRHGLEATRIFPEIALALSTWPHRLVLDGEVVVTDEQSRPRFQLLQQRVHLSRSVDIERAALLTPATYFVFDLLSLDGWDLRPLPLATRKALLAQVVPALGPVRYAEHIEQRGLEFYQAATHLGFEGMVAKRAVSAYRPGRQKSWLKVRALATSDFVIVGYSKSRRRGWGLGSLHLGAYRGDELVWCGHVGTGMTTRQRQELVEHLAADVQASPACSGVTERSRDDVWVQPRQCCEVRYTEWTTDGSLRQPVFVRLRDDKPLRDCTIAARIDDESVAIADVAVGDTAVATTDATAESVTRDVPYTHLEKLFWPADGYTKGDLLAYYRDIAPALMPYLRDRPLVLTRFPDGINGKSFFQKDAPKFVPAWIRTERIWSEQAARDIDYFIGEDVAALLYLVNLGTIPLHIWSSRVATLAQPDWCVVDFDPKGAPFADVIVLVRALHDLCESVGLPSHAKTSGQNGMHVYIPLGRQCTHEQSRSLAEVLAREIERRYPAISTMARPLSARQGRVYLDCGQNGQGRLVVAPFSARPVAGAMVAMPLAWNEVGPKLSPQAFTIRTARRRLDWLGDPLLPVLSETPDLVAALGRLAVLLPDTQPTALPPP